MRSLAFAGGNNADDDSKARFDPDDEDYCDGLSAPEKSATEDSGAYYVDDGASLSPDDESDHPDDDGHYVSCKFMEQRQKMKLLQAGKW